MSVHTNLFQTEEWRIPPYCYRFLLNLPWAVLIVKQFTEFSCVADLTKVEQTNHV